MLRKVIQNIRREVRANMQNIGFKRPGDVANEVQNEVAAKRLKPDNAPTHLSAMQQNV